MNRRNTQKPKKRKLNEGGLTEYPKADLLECQENQSTDCFESRCNNNIV